MKISSASEQDVATHRAECLPFACTSWFKQKFKHCWYNWSVNQWLNHFSSISPKLTWFHPVSVWLVPGKVKKWLKTGFKFSEKKKNINNIFYIPGVTKFRIPVWKYKALLMAKRRSKFVKQTRFSKLFFRT